MMRFLSVAAILAATLAPTLARAEEAIGEPEGSGSSAEAEGAPPAPNGDTVEQARALFLEGLELSDAGQLELAADRFRQALALHVAPTIRFNLAATLDQLDRDLEAAEQLDLLLQNSDTPEDLRDRAQALLNDVEGQIGRILVRRGELDWSAEVTVDGEPLEAEDFDVSFRVAPGPHLIVATLDGEEAFRREITAEAGQTIDVALEDQRPEDARATPAGQPRARGDDRRGGLVRDWRLWVGVGAGIVAIALGVGLGVGLSEPVTVLEEPVLGNMSPGVLTWR